MPVAMGMKEMDAILSVTDALGIHREAVTVPLRRKDPGEVRSVAGGQVHIVAPESVEIEAWLPVLRAELEKLGHRAPATEEG
jgi:hypothetical protein